jgi:amidase
MTAPASVTPFLSAREMLSALERREISSVELTEMHIERIQRLDGPIHSIINTTFDRARSEAAEADAKRSRGGSGPLLGLPFTMKESNAIAGLPQSAGILEMKGVLAEEDGAVGARALAAGAALLGQTNIPVALGDWQANSPVYGRTNNPWDLARSPGGSTGGGSAALAAGLTPLEFGSDIGGSVRIPAAFCGVYGHRPSETLVPRTGSFPGAARPNVASIMGVQGPLARSAYDLELALDVIAGPEVLEDIAWRVELPTARADSLKGLRVAVLGEMPGITVDDEMSARLEELATWLGQQGAKIGRPALPFDSEDYLADYSRVLSMRTSGPMSREARLAVFESTSKSPDSGARLRGEALTMWAHEFSRLMDTREAYRHAYHGFFKEWDVLLTPMALGPAFEHNDAPFHERRLQINGKEVVYGDTIVFPALAILAGLPATAFPGGLNGAGLPLGLQAVGPYLEDRTPLRFAQLVEDGWRRFEAPPGF